DADREPGRGLAARRGRARRERLPVLRLAQRRLARLRAHLRRARPQREPLPEEPPQPMTQPTPPTPEVFFTERFPAQMNRQLAEQEEAAAAAQRALEGMRALDATLRFEVRGEGGGTWYVNFAGGRASASTTPSHPPFLSITLDRAD